MAGDREASMTAIRRSGLAFVVLAGACAQNPPPVPLQGSPAGLESLAGHWSGGYSGGTADRSGSIEFTLAVGDDHAHGAVLMVPGRSRRAYHSWREIGPAQGSDPAQELTIRFVAVDNGELAGELDPYLDPACDCRALTRFRGRVKGNVVGGTFVTQRAEHAVPSHGTWEVRRRR
jgi:hypothetical protein